MPAAKATGIETGRVADRPLREVVKALAGRRFSGILAVRLGSLEGTLLLERGQVIDARLGDLRGKDAFFRAISARTGTWEARAAETDEVTKSLGDVDTLLEQVREHEDEIRSLASDVGGLDRAWAVRFGALKKALTVLPDEINPILRMLDGRRTVREILASTTIDDVLVLRVMHRLLTMGVLVLPDSVDDVVSSPVAATLGGGTVAVIGSDLPVSAQWFEEQSVPGPPAPTPEVPEPKPAPQSELPEPKPAPQPEIPEPEPEPQPEIPEPEPEPQPEIPEPEPEVPEPEPEPEPVKAAAPEPPIHRPLPKVSHDEPAASGPPSEVELLTWSTTGDGPHDDGFDDFAPRDLHATADELRRPRPATAQVDAAIEDWLRAESDFFEADVVISTRPSAVPARREPLEWARVVPAALFVFVIIGFLGFLVGKALSPAPEPLTDQEAWRLFDDAETLFAREEADQGCLRLRRVLDGVAREGKVWQAARTSYADHCE